MKLLYTLTTASILSLTAIANAHCGTCDKTAKKSCDKTTCEKSTCDKEKDCDTTAANTASFAVTGMTCKGCSAKVTKALEAVDGCTVGKVCHKSGKVSVTIDPAKTDKSKIQAAINATGFKVVGENLSIPVTGMTCGGCSKKVTKALEAIDGCTACSVCHKSGKATVTIDTAKTSEKAIIEAINKTGFKAATAKSKATKKEATAPQPKKS